MIKSSLTVIAAALLTVACSSTTTTTGGRAATATLAPTNGNTVNGSVTFTQQGTAVVVAGEVRARKATLLVLDGLITINEKAGSDLELKKFLHAVQFRP